MKYLQPLTFFVLLANAGTGQEVLASDGDYGVTASGSLSWTIGELLTETIENEEILTQGFQQSFGGNVGTTEIPGNPDWSVYPNPFTTTLIFSCGDAEPGAVSIYDGRSRLVMTINHPESLGGGTYKIDVSELMAGVYFMQIQEGTPTAHNTQRIVKL